MDTIASNQILTISQVEQRTGYKKSSIYAMEKDKIFPNRVRLGSNRVGWWSNEIDQWIIDRIAQFKEEQCNG